MIFFLVISERVEDVLSETKNFQLKCDARIQNFNVLNFNWILNGSYVHPSLNPGLTVLSNGDLNFDKVLPSHKGTVHIFIEIEIILKAYL